jgi:hypothetical protein
MFATTLYEIVPAVRFEHCQHLPLADRGGYPDAMRLCASWTWVEQSTYDSHTAASCKYFGMPRVVVCVAAVAASSTAAMAQAANQLSFQRRSCQRGRRFLLHWATTVGEGLGEGLISCSITVVKQHAVMQLREW